MVGLFGGSDVPCVPYSTFGTESLASDAANALDKRAACLLGNHGMICRGGNFDIAIGHAERMEILCKHYVLARQLGEPDLLTDDQWDEFLVVQRKWPTAHLFNCLWHSSTNSHFLDRLK